MNTDGAVRETSASRLLSYLSSVEEKAVELTKFVDERLITVMRSEQVELKNTLGHDVKEIASDYPVLFESMRVIIKKIDRELYLIRSLISRVDL